MLQRRTGHRYAVRPKNVGIDRQQTDGFSMLGAYFVYFLIAEPPGNALGPRKFVFDAFSCGQGPHVDIMLAWVLRGKSQMLKFHEKSTSPGS